MERKPKPKGLEKEGSCPQPHSRLLSERCGLAPLPARYCRGPRQCTFCSCIASSGLEEHPRCSQ